MSAEPVRVHRREIIGIGFRRAFTALRASRGGRLPSRLNCRSSVLNGRIAVAPAVLLGVNGCGWGGMRRRTVLYFRSDALSMAR
jgi:hypothetical protein